MTLPGFPPHAESKDATRRARAFLNANIRNDWSYPKSGRGSRPYDTHDHAARGEVAWTQRRYSSGDETLEADPASSPGRRSSIQRSVARSRRESRLRRELNDECSVNAGLEHWCARRDAWTGAKCASSTAGGDSHPSVTSPRSVRGADGADAGSNDEDEQMVLLPIPQPILQDHPVRAKVDRNAYGEIYSKVISQSRTPSIPINLVHVTRSLVHGWKAEGNWPPKETAAEAAIGRKKVAKGADGHARVNPLLKGVAALGRAFKSG